MIDVQWAFISIFTSSLVNFILRIVLGRELGPEGLGVYTLAFTIYLFGVQFAAFGIGSAQTFYIAESIDNHPTIRKYVSSGMTSSIITGILMGVGFFYLAPYIAISFFKNPELVGLIQLISLTFPFIAIQKSVLGTLNGFRTMHLYALINILQNISTVSLSVILVLVFRMGVQGAVVGLVAPTIIIGILSPLLIREHLGLDHSLWDIPAIRATTVFGFYAVLANSVSYLNNQINSVFIGYYLNPTEVGIFAVAVLLSQTLTLIPNAIQTVTNPVMATLNAKEDLEGVRRIFYSTLRKSFFIAAGSAVLLAVFSPFIISLLFGEKFLTSYISLLLLLPGSVILASYMAVGTTLASIGKVHIIFRIGIISVVINIIMNILLIPSVGIEGAAIATSMTAIINFGITVTVVRYYITSK